MERDNTRLRARLLPLDGGGLALVTGTRAEEQGKAQYRVRHLARDQKSWSAPEQLGTGHHNLTWASGGGSAAVAWTNSNGAGELFAFHAASNAWRAVPLPVHLGSTAHLELAMDAQGTLTAVSGVAPTSGGPAAMYWGQTDADPKSQWKSGRLQDPRKPIVPADHRPIAALAVDANQRDVVVFAAIVGMVKSGEFDYFDALDLVVFRKRGGAEFETLPVVVGSAHVESQGLRELAMRGVHGFRVPAHKSVAPFAFPTILEDGAVAVGWLAAPRYVDGVPPSRSHVPWLYEYRNGWRAKQPVTPAPGDSGPPFEHLMAGALVTSSSGAQMVWFDGGLRVASPGANGAMTCRTSEVIRSYQGGQPLVVENHQGAAAAAWTDAGGIKASVRAGPNAAWSPTRVLIPNAPQAKASANGVTGHSTLVDLAIGPDGTLYIAYEHVRKRSELRVIAIPMPSN